MDGKFAQLLKVAGLRMVPFFKTVALFFVLNTHQYPGHVWSTVLKCVPIYSLMVFVLLSGFSLRKEHYYSQRILLGLLFSSFGDALLNHDLFPHGMGAFAVAQIFYISAFGLRPLKLWIPMVLYSAGGFMVYLIFENLPDIIQVGLPIYSLLLLGMVWRAIARLDGEYSNLTKLAAAVGGFIFAVSDSLIAIDMFYYKVPHAKVLIMVTYYIAQFGITLSILDLTTESAIRHKAAKKTDMDIMSASPNPKVTAVGSGVRQRGSGSNSN